MTITYPMTQPSTSQWGRVQIRRKHFVAVQNMPFTGATRVYNYGGGVWEADVELALRDATDTDTGAWLALWVALEGPWGTFFWGDPSRKVALGVATGTPLVAGAGQAVGAKTLNVDGFTASTSNIMRRGDYFALDNNLYQVTEDANSVGGGAVTLSHWPPLRKVPADNAALDVTEPQGIFRVMTPANHSISPDFMVKGDAFTIQDVPQL